MLQNFSGISKIFGFLLFGFVCVLIYVYYVLLYGYSIVLRTYFGADGWLQAVVFSGCVELLGCAFSDG